jgi:hypothetical protein
MSLYDELNAGKIWEKIRDPQRFEVVGDPRSGVVEGPSPPPGACWVVLAADLHLQAGQPRTLWIARVDVAVTTPRRLARNVPAALTRPVTLPPGEYLTGRSDRDPSRDSLVLRAVYLEVDPRYLPRHYLP